jgi:quinol monooxygenase YgiN
MMVISNNMSAQQKTVIDNSKPIVLFVEFEFDTKDMDLAVELLTEMQNQTIENEERCIAYDMLLNVEAPNTIYLYECYENKAALDLHNNATYFKKIVNDKLTPLIKAKKILKLNPINDIGIMM